MNQILQAKKHFLFWENYLMQTFCIFVFVAIIVNSIALAESGILSNDEFGVPEGEGAVWDFTKTVPEGGVLRPGAVLRGGLISTTFNIEAASGFQLSNTKFKHLEAFRFEAQFIPGCDIPEGTDRNAIRSGIIWDSLYVTYKKDPPDQYNRGFQVALENTGENQWRPRLYFGYGKLTDALYGPIAVIPPGKSVRLVFFYDGNGTVRWDFAGQMGESETSQPGALAESRLLPTIGDRIGSNYDQFPGKIERVVISPCRRLPFGIMISGRKVFYRGEKETALSIRLIKSIEEESFDSLKLTAILHNQGGKTILKKTVLDAKVLLDTQATLEIPLETRLATGRYPLELKLLGQRAGKSDVVVSRTINLGIGPIFTERFLTQMWGYLEPVEQLKTFGFTHGLTSLGLSDLEPSQELQRQITTRLDQALFEGLRLSSHVAAQAPREPVDGFYRIARDGSVLLSNKKPMLEVSNPAVIEYTRKIAAVNAFLNGKHPAFAGILANTEQRDGVLPSFRSEPKVYQAETGRKIPDEVTGAVPPRSIGKKRFPDGKIPDDDSLLAYYSWFWNGGDGWPRINTAIAEEYRKATPKTFFSFFDPAVRVPPKWGSGGKVDVLSQWVYAVPEPLAVAGPIEELFTMAAGHNQRVMIMTQIICYRNEIAPKNKTVTSVPAWVTEKPDADFPAIPPDSLQEATWAMIAKPVEGIMYHGYQCIFETGAKTGYTFTNTETPKRLTHLLKNVVAPIGPTLKKLPREDSPVVVLESFANALFSGYATWGWKAPDLLFLQRARLDPRVIYDETILRDGFGNAKVLFMPQCAFLTESVLAKIIEFQKKGGIIIGDKKLLPAIKANIDLDVLDLENAQARNRLDNIEETTTDKKDVAAVKAKMNADASALRKKLDPLYVPRADSSDPELITFSRRWQNVDYLFVINDHRTYGDYVGQWKKTMEKGLPFEGFITLVPSGQKIGAVYELSRGGKIPFIQMKNGSVRVDLKYETNDGRLLMFLEKAIASIALETPDSVTRGEKGHLTLRILDAEGLPIHALLPVEMRVFDASGRELDGAGYTCAEDGICTLDVLTNLNDPDGVYRVTAKDRASGLTIEKSFKAK